MTYSKNLLKAWFANANEDLISAQALFDLGPDKHLRVIPYLCQQAAEKSIKGFLTFHKIKFTYTHDLGKLASQVVEIDPNLKNLMLQADDLTDYAVQFRYPDASSKRDPLLEDSISALKIARQVFEEMSSRIPFNSMWDL